MYLFQEGNISNYISIIHACARILYSYAGSVILPWNCTSTPEGANKNVNLCQSRNLQIIFIKPHKNIRRYLLKKGECKWLVSMSLAKYLLGFWVYSLPTVGLAAWAPGQCWFGPAAGPWIQLLWKKLSVKKSCKKFYWGLFLICLSALFKLRPLLIAAAWLLLHLCLWLDTYALSQTLTYRLNCLVWLRSCFCITDLSSPGLLLPFAATWPVLLFFFWYCGSVPLLMKPVPALLDGFSSLRNSQPLLLPVGCFGPWVLSQAL